LSLKRSQLVFCSTSFALFKERNLCFIVWDKLKTLEAQAHVLASGMKALPPIDVNTIDSRDQFLKALKSDRSDILYVFAHGHSCVPTEPAISALLEKCSHLEQTPFTRQIIELFKDPTIPGLSEGDDSWIKLTKSLVTSADLRRDEYVLTRHPIVFLNMCQSAVLWPGVSGSFVRLFLDRQASAVLGTECTIPENVADEFGRVVITNLFQGESLGTSLLHAREELARSNNLLGLAYTLYGSASSRIVNPSTSIAV
jgi:CHAT domain